MARNFFADNPRQLADEQHARNRQAAIESSNISRHGTVSPWQTIRWSGEPGKDLTQHITLPAARQAALEEADAANLRLQRMLSDYVLPNIERSFASPIRLDKLPPLASPYATVRGPQLGMASPLPGMGVPQVGPTGDMPNLGAAPMQQLAGLMAQQPQQPQQQQTLPNTYLDSPVVNAGPAQTGMPSTYLGARPETPMQDTYRDEMDTYRQAMDDYRERMAAREPITPEAVPESVLREYYAATNPDKMSDIPRFLRENQLTAGEGGYNLDMLMEAANRAFPGASERSEMILAGLPDYLDTWARQNAEMPDIGPAPEAPMAPGRQDLFAAQQPGPTQYVNPYQQGQPDQNQLIQQLIALLTQGQGG